MNVTELAAEIAKRYTCVEGLYMAYCQTGEKYVMIGHENLKPCDREPSGRPIPGVIRESARLRKYRTEPEACDDLLKAFDLYADHWLASNPEGKAPTLYWRYAAPHVFMHDSPRKAWLYGRMRLVLSNRPVVFATMEEYDAWRTQHSTQEINAYVGQQPQPAYQG